MISSSIPSIRDLEASIRETQERLQPELMHDWTDRYLYREGNSDLVIARENILLYFDREYIQGENMFSFWKEIPSLYVGVMKEKGEVDPVFSHTYQSAYASMTHDIYGLYRNGVNPPFDLRIYSTALQKFGATIPFWRSDAIRAVAFAAHNVARDVIENKDFEMNLRYAVIGSFIHDDTISFDSITNMSIGTEWALTKRAKIIESFNKEIITG